MQNAQTLICDGTERPERAELVQVTRRCKMHFDMGWEESTRENIDKKAQSLGVKAQHADNVRSMTVSLSLPRLGWGVLFVTTYHYIRYPPQKRADPQCSEAVALSFCSFLALFPKSRALLCTYILGGPVWLAAILPARDMMCMYVHTYYVHTYI